MTYPSLCAALAACLALIGGLSMVGGSPAGGEGNAEKSDPQGGQWTPLADCTPGSGVFEEHAPLSVNELLGARVINPRHEKLGRVMDLVVDPRGCVVGMVVHEGGFMGVGSETTRIPMTYAQLVPLERNAGWVVMIRKEWKRFRSHGERRLPSRPGQHR